MGRRKKGNPMKWWGFYSTDELKEETKKLAEMVDENDSEYIRRAVEERNKDVLKDVEKEKKKVRKSSNKKCLACNGTGYYDCSDKNGNSIKCGACGGTGREVKKEVEK